MEISEAHYNLGNALGQEGRYDAAILHYRIAIDSKPDYAEAHRNLGTDLDRNKEHDAAITEFAGPLN